MGLDTEGFVLVGLSSAHESEYFDPARPVDKAAGDTRWAIELATAARAAVDAELSGR